MEFKKNNNFRPHKKVEESIDGNKNTSFSNLPFFDEKLENLSTINKIASEEFNKVSSDVALVGEMNLTQIMSSLAKISLIEKDYIKDLENLAIKKVGEQFGIPNNIMERVKIKLVKSIDSSEITSQEKKTKESFTEEEENIIKNYVEKRKIQNALCMGSGFRSHITFNSIKEDLDKIDKRLFPLYNKTIPNISLFLWKFPFEDCMDNVNVMGVSKLTIDEDKKIKAEASAVIFPILLHETAKAAVELLFLNSTKQLTEKFGKNVAQEIINQSDIFEEEIWMKRIGPTLWSYFHNVAEYVIKSDRKEDYKLMSFIINKVSLLEPEDFKKFIKDTIYNTESAIAKINSMIDEIEDEFDACETIKKSIPKEYKDMDWNELNTELKNAIDEERYEDAAKISKVIREKQ